ncbi:MAG: GUN4 domain-containing protein [Pseudanabaenales cyanobacterium]|nr:GUN4 domain-containing protein [Pseudanabaenales cyanobacterium]
MSFIFISYSRQDQAYVSKLKKALEERGLPVWWDKRIDHGEMWNRVIEEHLEQCQVFLLVMSPRSLKSRWVQNELIYASELQKPIFPILLEGKRWLDVASIQMADVTGGKLPPDRFFKKVSGHFPELEVASQYNSIQDVSEEDKLVSERGDYTRLQDLLKARNWKAANEETVTRMCKAINQQEDHLFYREDINNFPRQDLRIIDQLWVKYSNGRFGFSVQKKIWQACGSPEGSGKEWGQFGTIVGWQTEGGEWLTNPQLAFNSEAPKGHLPCYLYLDYSGWDSEEYEEIAAFCSLLSRQDL